MIILIILIILVLLSFNLFRNLFKNRSNTLEDTNEQSSVRRKQFSMYVENDSGEYDEYNFSELFPIGYELNLNKSTCVDINGLEVPNILSSNGNAVTVTSNKTVFCYVYFDKDNSVYAKVVSDYKNGNGVSKLSDSDKGDRDYDTYYYTGNITNNNVLYADHCWKMVITTEGEGVKMIYNGVPTDGSCDNSGDDATIGTSAFNTSWDSPAYVGYMYNNIYNAFSKGISNLSTEYLYGNSFVYNNDKYTINETIKISDMSTIYNSLSNNHYTCFNTTGICEKIYYIFGIDSSNLLEYLHYISLTNGKGVDDALNEMLYVENVNKYDSTIKGVIDNWYESNLLSKKDSAGNDYSSYLQNTIYCNNREVIDLAGWEVDGGSLMSYMSFNCNTLDCANIRDQFTLSVDNGGTKGYGNNALKYPIGLLNYKEVNLATLSGYLYNSQYYWLIAPYYFADGPLGFANISLNQSLTTVRAEENVRPAISLSSNVKITIGDGSVDNPYQVKLSS